MRRRQGGITYTSPLTSPSLSTENTEAVAPSVCNSVQCLRASGDFLLGIKTVLLEFPLWLSSYLRVLYSYFKGNSWGVCSGTSTWKIQLFVTALRTMLQNWGQWSQFVKLEPWTSFQHQEALSISGIWEKHLWPDFWKNLISWQSFYFPFARWRNWTWVLFFLFNTRHKLPLESSAAPRLLIYLLFFAFVFLGLHPWHMEVPRLGV